MSSTSDDKGCEAPHKTFPPFHTRDQGHDLFHLYQATNQPHAHKQTRPQRGVLTNGCNEHLCGHQLRKLFRDVEQHFRKNRSNKQRSSSLPSRAEPKTARWQSATLPRVSSRALSSLAMQAPAPNPSQKTPPTPTLRTPQHTTQREVQQQTKASQPVQYRSAFLTSSSSGWGADPVPRSGSGSCTRTEYIGAARAQASRILVKEKSASPAWWDCVLLARPALLFSADHHTHLGLRLCGLCVAVSVKLGVRWHLCLLRFAGVRELLPLFFCFICLLFHDGVAQPRGQLFLSGARSFCGGKPRPGDAVTRQGQCGERAARAPTQHATS